MKLSDEQKNYIGAPLDKHVYLKACPGSGKTEVIAAMVAKAIGEWKGFPAGIAVLTFSNSATDELRDRLVRYLGEPVPFPHLVSTFDSFVLSRLVANIASEVTEFPGKDGDGRIRILENKADIFHTRTKISGRRISACKYNYDLDTKGFTFSTGDRVQDTQLNAAVINEAAFRDLIETKKRLWKAGFATYRDVDMIALSAFKKPELNEYFRRIAKRFPLVIVDECQDLSAEQLAMVKKLHQLGVKFHFVGDLNQSIYGFRKSNPVNVKKLLGELSFAELALTANWRSGQAIVDLCSDLLQIERVTGNPEIEPLKPLLLQYAKCPSELLPKIIELTSAYKHVVVVARGHSTLQRFRKGDKFTGVEVLALACVAAESGSLKELNVAIALFAEWFADKLSLQVTHTGPHCPVVVESKLAWRKFVHQSLKHMIATGAGDMNLTWKEWAAVAKRAIRSLPEQPFVLAEIRNELEPLRSLIIRSPAKQGDIALSVRLSQGVAQQSSVDGLRYETIHQVKGETHDATVVVSSRQRGVHLSHWRDWLADPTSEGSRFAYVASSRPRHMLIWAVKQLKAVEKDTLTGLGFEFA
ncbi:DNA helicase UvrD [Pseudomonas sp. FW215-R2]|uniref:UvrD-helicase domain-containing protein n=1 Tax=unclassified Pseudomonas TaxID=196821 RepID=UPI000C886461|nr:MULTISPECIES: ATP-dependent helicase [unclassified Pseudomonas]PMX03265.1 DNA helicase UvrD [Pseudomonas sp. FW215-R2]PMX12073.1 DNA helicase UvrD [Pseudomonas sp. FW215-L1]PMX25813.1 DNA helicase UvrD [Pseudomonas sp. FW215-E1]PNA32745.1 DNA helicase UvrD [Pseudomonas sp. FW215-R4]